MAKWKSVIGAIGLVGFVIASIGVLPASGQQEATIHKEVFSKNSEEHLTQIDVGKKSFSNGDRFIGRSPVFDAQDTSERVGNVWIDGSIVALRKEVNHFNLTFHFPEGKIMVAGALAFSESGSGGTLAVVGGSGDYTHAHGTMVLEDTKIEGEAGAKFTFDMLID